MNTDKIAIPAAQAAGMMGRNMYQISSAEVTAIEIEVANAIHEACIRVHEAQCDAVARDCYTPAARLEAARWMLAAMDALGQEVTARG